MNYRNLSAIQVETYMHVVDICNNEELAAKVTLEGHIFEVIPWWSDDGSTGIDFLCSCGFHTCETTGRSEDMCSEPDLDGFHAALLLLAVERAEAIKMGRPADRFNYRVTAISALLHVDEVETETSRFLRRTSDAPKISQLKKLVRVR